MVNTRKCSVLLFRTPQSLKNILKPHLKDPFDTEISHDTQQTYLGILLDPLLSFTSHAEAQDNKILAQFRSAYNISSILSTIARKSSAINLLILRLEYGLPLFSSSAINSTVLQRAENQILMFFLLVLPNEHHCNFIHKANWLPIPGRSSLLLNSLTFKILKCGYCPPLSKKLHFKQSPYPLRDSEATPLLSLSFMLAACEKSYVKLIPSKWNLLPGKLHRCKSLSAFKKSLKHLKGSNKCSCFRDTG